MTQAGKGKKVEVRPPPIPDSKSVKKVTIGSDTKKK